MRESSYGQLKGRAGRATGLVLGLLLSFAVAAGCALWRVQPASAGMVDQAPVANVDSAVISQGQSLSTLSVLANDYDPDNDALSVQLVVGPSHAASFSLNTSTGYFTYTPAPGYSGTDQFRYRIYDGLLWSLTVPVMITTVNVPPVANDDGQLVQLPVHSDVATADDEFGFATAVDGNTAVVTSRKEDSVIGPAAYIYVRNGASWSRQAVLRASTQLNAFGQSAAISGDTVAIGASAENGPSGQLGVGAVYVYERTGSSWSGPTRLVASDGVAHDSFGASVAIDGDTMLVGTRKSPGVAYVFTRSGGVWTQRAELHPATSRALDDFGFSVALNNGTAVVGAPMITNGTGNGFACVFTGSGASWSQQATLTATDGMMDDRLGWSVAVKGDTLVLGAPCTDPGGQSNAGAVYVFTRAGSTWTQRVKLFSPVVSYMAQFGYSVAYDGTFIGVGEPLAGPYGPDGFSVFCAGAAYLYRASGSSWALYQTLTEPVLTAEQHYGVALALADGNLAVTGWLDVPGSAFLANLPYVTAEDTPLSISAPYGLLHNDTDAGGDVITPSLVDTSALHGTLVLAADGSFTYTPESNFTGLARATYQVVDSHGAASNVATIAIQVGPVNDPPVVVPHSATVHAGGLLSGPSVLIGASDAEGDSLTTYVQTPPAHAASFSFNPVTGTYLYQPVAGYVGTDSFVYGVSDGHGGTATAAVTITVANAPPVSASDTYTVAEDTTLSVAAPGVLANDTDPDGDALSASLVDTSAAHGRVSLAADGSLVYTPSYRFVGNAVITYKAGDGLAYSVPSTITIAVTAVNHAPVAVDDSATIHAGRLLTGHALTNDTDEDGDALTASLVSGPAHAKSFALAVDGTYTYTSAAGFAGVDSFSYQASDGHGGTSLTARVSINVTNTAPVAVSDVATVSAGTTAHFNILGNDTDADGDALTVAGYSQPSTGTLAVSPSGDVAYTPPVGYVGTTSATYKVSDGVALSASATVTFVATADRPPVAVSDGTMQQLTKLTASDRTSGQWLGYSAAISGDTAIVGAPQDNSSAGAAYVYVRSGGVWVQSAKLIASDRVAGDDFGWSVALSGDTAVVGAQADDSYTGAAYVFTRSGGAWSQTAKLTATDAASPAQFGFAVAVSGDTAVITANRDDVSKGAAYIFTRSGGTWSQSTKLVPAGVAPYDHFGDSAAISGDTVIVGSSWGDSMCGYAYVFTGSGSTWTPGTKLVASDRAAYDYFGVSVGISGDTAIVGACGDDNMTGSAYVFTRSNGDWTQSTKLTAADRVANDYFGFTVAISGTTAIVGANQDDSQRGSAYVYAGAGARWQPYSKFTAPDGATSDNFGRAVALSGDQAIIGAFRDDSGAGSAYVLSTPYVTDEDVALRLDAAGGVLANDFDPDGTGVVPSLLDTSALHGTLALAPDGSFTYTPDKDWNGIAVATYRDRDPVGVYSDPATITITVRPVNDAPVAVDHAYATDEDTTLTISAPGMLSGATDAEGDTLAVSLLDTSSAHGSIALKSDGSFTYAPDKDWNGTARVTYRVFDGAVYSDPATITLTVRPVDDVPTGLSDHAYATDEDTALVVAAPGLLAGVTDVEGDPLTPSLVDTSAAHGAFTLGGDGRFTYTPDKDWSGTASATYRVFDGTAYSDPATITITVRSVNSAPVAAEDATTCPFGGSATIDVLANDFDAEGNALTPVLASGPAHGTAVLMPDGTFVYAPAQGFGGTDTFTYRAFDGAAYSDPATVTITVNAPPVAADDPDLLNPTRLAAVAPSAGNGFATSLAVDGDTAVVGARSYYGNKGAAYIYTRSGSDWTRTAELTATLGPLDKRTDISFGCSVAIRGNQVIVGAETSQNETDTSPQHTGQPAIGTAFIYTRDTDGTWAQTARLIEKNEQSWDAGHAVAIDGDSALVSSPDSNGGVGFVYWFRHNVATGIWSQVGTLTPNYYVGSNNYDIAFGSSVSMSGNKVVVGTPNRVFGTGDAYPFTLPVPILNPYKKQYLPDGYLTGNYQFLAPDGERGDRLGSSVAFSGNTVLVGAPGDDGGKGSVRVFDFTTHAQIATLAAGTSEASRFGTSVAVQRGFAIIGAPAATTFGPGTGAAYLYTGQGGDWSQGPVIGTPGSGGALGNSIALSGGAVMFGEPAAASGKGAAYVENCYVTDQETTLSVDASSGVLANDSDPEGGTLTPALLDTSALHGTLALNSDGSFTYRPDAGWYGIARATYRDKDPQGAYSAPATITVVVRPDAAPVAKESTYTADEDTTLTVNAPGLLSGATDAEGDTLTAALLDTSSVHGTLALDADGSFTYKPAAGWHGTAIATYRAFDGIRYSDPTTVTIVVAAAPAPAAVDDTATAYAGRALVGGVLGNDLRAVSAAVATPTVHGTLDFRVDGTYTYTPGASFEGTDTFTYQAFNSDGVAALGTVTIRVLGDLYVDTNGSDVAGDGSAAAPLATLAKANSLIGSGHTIHVGKGTFQCVDLAVTPNVSIQGEGSSETTLTARGQGRVLDYQLPGTATLADLTVAEGTTDGNGAGVNAVNTNLTVTGCSFSGNYAGLRGGSLYFWGPGALTLSRCDISENSAMYGGGGFYSGRDDGTGDADVVISDCRFIGNSSRTYAGGFSLNSAVATITNTVVARNSGDGIDLYATPAAIRNCTIAGNSGAGVNVSLAPAPSIENSIVWGNAGGSIGGTAAVSCSDIQGGAAGAGNIDADPLFKSDYNLMGGSPAIDTGSLMSAPAADLLGLSRPQGLGVDMGAYEYVFTPRVARDDSATGDDTRPVTLNVLGNDDPSESTVAKRTAVLLSAPAEGFVSLSPSGDATFTPPANWSGTASFQYVADYETTQSAPATVTITVGHANHAPVAADASATVHAGSLLDGPSVLALASDPDGDVLTAGVGTAPAHAASFSLDPITGTYLYRPAPGYVGTDAFTYRVSDGNGGEATASITISVTDSAPVAVSDSLSADQDTTLSVAAPACSQTTPTQTVTC